MPDDKKNYRDKKSEYVREFADQVINLMEQDLAPWQREWDVSASQVASPRNPISGTVYSGNNRLRLAIEGMAKGYDDPRWMTFNQASSEGYKVKKNSKGTPILHFKTHTLVDKRDDEGNIALDENGEPEKVMAMLARPIITVSHVFNAKQIEGYPPLSPEDSIKHEWDPIEKAEKLLEKSDVQIFNDNNSRAFYNRTKDEIHLPPKEQFREAGGYYATALHELGHATGHESRLNRQFGNFGDAKYAREELRAEIGSWMLCNDLGIPHNPVNHASYVKSWAQILKDKPEEIIYACNDADKIKEFVLDYDREPEQQKIQNRINERKSAEKSAENVRSEGKIPVNPAQEKTYLFVPYAEKDLAKAHGAKWDKAQKSWYAPEGTDLEPLKKWLEPPQQAIMAQKQLDPREEFAEKLKAMGLDLQGELPVMDGKLHRVPVEGKNGRGLDGAYCLYSDGRPAGWAQNYVTGQLEKLVATGVVLSPEAREAQKLERQQKLLQREAQLKEQQDLVANKAERLFNSYLNKDSTALHPYLLNKGVEPFGVKITNFNDKAVLAVPIQNIEGKIRGLQYIDEDGNKNFLSGMEKKGCFHLIDDEKNKSLAKTEIVLCEGYATGASLHMATGKPVAVAFDAGNVRQVAEKLREKFPQAQIVIAADNDHTKVNNIGLENAKIAAKAVGGKVVVPTFSKEEKEKGYTDFNDLHKSRGLKEVKSQYYKQLEKDRGWER